MLCPHTYHKCLVNPNAFTHSLRPHPRSPQQVAWRKMPTELAKPFLAQAKTTRRNMWIGALAVAVGLKFALPALV